MTTIESEQYSPTRSETKTENWPTPILDLIDTQSLAEEILQAAVVPYVGKLAEQIIANCEYDDMARIRELAEEIRRTDDEQSRARYASEIIGEISGMIDARSAEIDAAAAEIGSAST
jgi:hypothetical protein